MGLQAQTPLRMGQAVLDGDVGCSRPVRAVHRLQEEWSKRRCSNASGGAPSCGKTSFNSSPAVRTSRGAGFRADADPVEPGRGRSGAVGLDRHERNPSSCSASTASASSWSSGSPPVHTT